MDDSRKYLYSYHGQHLEITRERGREGGREGVSEFLGLEF